MPISDSSSTTEQITVRGLRYGIRHWGNPEAPVVFFLHGWMDSSATFEFVVDALKTACDVIAPDWRGHGQSEWLSLPYWFSDYYADLHCILENYSRGGQFGEISLEACVIVDPSFKTKCRYLS